MAWSARPSTTATAKCWRHRRRRTDGDAATQSDESPRFATGQVGSLAFALALYLSAWVVMRHGALLSPRLSAFPRWPVLFDFLLTAPAFSWWLHRRDRKKAWRNAIGIAASGLLAAGYLIPHLSSESTRELFDLRTLLLAGSAAAELFFIAQMLRYIGNAARGASPEYALQDWLGSRIGSRALGRAIGFEARMWLYALMPQRKTWHYCGDQHFSYHLKDGYAANLQGYLVLLLIGLPAQNFCCSFSAIHWPG